MRWGGFRWVWCLGVVPGRGAIDKAARWAWCQWRILGVVPVACSASRAWCQWHVQKCGRGAAGVVPVACSEELGVVPVACSRLGVVPAGRGASGMFRSAASGRDNEVNVG
jgi:hypothetical protein